MTAAGCSTDSQASAATGGRATDHFQTETVPTARVWLRRTGRGSLQHRVCVQSNEKTPQRLPITQARAGPRRFRALSKSVNMPEPLADAVPTGEN